MLKPVTPRPIKNKIQDVNEGIKLKDVIKSCGMGKTDVGASVEPESILILNRKIGYEKFIHNASTWRVICEETTTSDN